MIFFPLIFFFDIFLPPFIISLLLNAILNILLTGQEEPHCPSWRQLRRIHRPRHHQQPLRNPHFFPHQRQLFHCMIYLFPKCSFAPFIQLIIKNSALLSSKMTNPMTRRT